MRALFAAIGLAFVPYSVGAQETPADTTVQRVPESEIGLRMHLSREPLLFGQPAALLPFGRLARVRRPGDLVAESRALAFQQILADQRAALWGQTAHASFAGISPGVTAGDSAAAPAIALALPVPAAPGSVPAPAPPTLPSPGAADSARGPGRQGPSAGKPIEIFGDYADLALQLQSRLEAKAERTKNERCVASDALNPLSNCKGSLQPQFDFQFGVRTGGVVADRVHVNVDYDSQREFDASNNISVYYEGKPDEIIHRLEVGNVSFAPPASRFITGGIPAGNYGLQAVGQLGPMSFRTILAQQKGNVVKDRVFTVGDRTVQAIDREIEDYQIERRRFFWIVDPAKTFAGRFPNIDILDRNLPSLAAQIPASERPISVLLYRYRPPSTLGSAARDINGPYAVARFARNTNVIGPYEVLQQGVDYYIDPSNLWVALVSPINRGERLGVSYTVAGPGGTQVVSPSVGGTFPTTRNAIADTVNLLWDNEILPGDTAFNREIRSVYRLGGDDIQRGTVTLKIVVGSGGDQEKPAGGTVDTYLQLFGLAQATNSSSFDVENRLWPRVGDQNQASNAGGGNARLIKDYFIIFPSLRPFSDSGLAHPPNPVNDSLYRTPDEDIISQRRPPTQYRIRARYSAEGGGESGSLTLGSVQVRQSSERLAVDGVPLTRDVDYTVDYEIGRVVFLRPDTLFPRPRQVSVQYEENPLFAAAPTSIFGIATQFPMQNGQLNFTAISQSQKTTFNRPPLGFEPASAFIAGVNGNFTFESAMLTRALNAIPFVETTTPSLINVQGEFATSRPQPNAAGVAYVESFEGEGGISIALQEGAWRLGSQPAVPSGTVPLGGVPFDFALDSATTLVWQNIGTTIDPVTRQPMALQFFSEQIDSQFVFTGSQAFRTPEVVLWNILYPRSIGGFLRRADTTFRWLTPAGPAREWRSISQSLGPSGVDLSRIEHLEFYALIDTTTVARRSNPTFVLDFGDVSENSVAFVPETLTVTAFGGSGTRLDSTFTGRKLSGFDTLDTERDPITRSFDASTNDVGIPGDLASGLLVRNLDSGSIDTVTGDPLCDRSRTGALIELLGDTRATCTVNNRRLDEEDMDLDGFLNIRSDSRNTERLLRYVIDMSDASTFNRIGRCYRRALDTASTGGGSVCWVHFRVPFSAPTETVNDPLVRRIKAVRLTLVSSPLLPEIDFTQVAIARLKLVGSPWVKRAYRPLAGVGGSRVVGGSGFVIASIIGTLDRDSVGGLFYQSPPGVTDQADSKQSGYNPGAIQINERSLRLVSGDLPLHHRAEAYFRFPEGEKNFMGYQELRVWARGRNKGWGQNGDLQFYVKIGRDPNNFYLYRAPANEGTTIDAWRPEVLVEFSRLFALRARIQNNYLRDADTLSGCSGLDSALVAASEVQTTPGTRRFVACDSGYIAYTSNPGISPPNLAAVQELSVGMVRVSIAGAGSGGLILPNDSLEVWVDDIRLTGVVDDPGYAGQLGMNIAAGDVGALQLNISRRDKNFRQLAEQPSYITDNQFNIGSSLRLDKFLPQALGLVLPFSINHVSSSTDPFFLSRSDIRAGGIEGLRTPKQSATAYTLSARRAVPLRNPILGLVANNVSLNTNYSTASSRSEFSVGNAKSFSGNVDFTLAAPARTRRMPRWLGRTLEALPAWIGETEAVRALRGSTLRWNPTQLRFTSAYVNNSDRRSSFTLPIVFEDDTARRVTGVNRLWRNNGALELRPFNSISARLDFASLRDLRRYADTTPVGVVAGAERQQFVGVDVGLERERQMSSAFSFAPQLSAWIRPRLDFSTTYSMLRDPNASNLLRLGHDSSGAFRLPRRLSNSQGLGASATFDLSRAIIIYTGDSSFFRRFAQMFQPLEVNWRRDLRSTYDGVAFDPSVGYQFALGGLDGFRKSGGVFATGAGLSRNLSVSHTLVLPFNFTLSDRYSRLTSTSWTNVVGTQSQLDAQSVVFPDISLRWNYRPGIPLIRNVIQSVGGQAGARVTKATSRQPTLAASGSASAAAGIRSAQTTRQYPVNGSIAWSAFGGFSTSMGWNKTSREELRAGGVNVGEQQDMNADVGKSFALPKSWNVQGNTMRTRLGYQQSRARTFFLGDSTRKRVTDNGRWSVNGSGDADLSENLAFSLTLSRIVNFDNNYNRRFAQTVISAVLHLQFFAGELK
ncbi:MAG: cell surface protein SprA [Gemmatimonadaceae bacterium]